MTNSFQFVCEKYLCYPWLDEEEEGYADKIFNASTDRPVPEFGEMWQLRIDRPVPKTLPSR